MLPQIANEQVVSTIQSTIRLPTGVTLNYVEEGNEEGEAVILLHGYTDSSHSYALVLPLLSQRYHIFALDQRGHGNSSKVMCCYKMSDFVGDVIAFMDAKGIGKATVVGHSLGATIAQLVAIGHPERVARLVLVGAMVDGGHEGLVEFNAVVQRLVDPIDPAFIRDFQLGTLFRSVPPAFFERVMVESQKVPAHVWRRALAGFFEQDTTNDLPKIKAPTLILWGDQDLIAPWIHQQTLRQLIPNATLRVYEQTGHDVHWEQPEEFVAQLEEFLQKTLV